MRLSSSIKPLVFALFLGVLAGCQAGGQGGGWRGLSWNPANWGRPNPTALARSDAPTKPSDDSLPTLAVSQGTEVPADNTMAPPSQFAGTTAGYNAAPTYPAPSGYPSPSGTSGSTPGSYVSPQQGAYGAYGGVDAADTSMASSPSGYPTTRLPRDGDVNPYRSSAEAAATASVGAASPNTSSPNTAAQYASSLQPAANPNHDNSVRYENDPNSRFYGGSPTTAMNAVPNAPYASNAYPSAAPPAYPGVPEGTTRVPSDAPMYGDPRGDQPSNPGYYASAPNSHTPDPNAYQPSGAGHSPAQPVYTASAQGSPTAGSAGSSSAPAYGGTPAPFRPGSCTSYPSTTGSSLNTPASPAPASSPYGAYYPSQGTAAPSAPASSGYQAPGYQPSSYY